MAKTCAECGRKIGMIDWADSNGYCWECSSRRKKEASAELHEQNEKLRKATEVEAQRLEVRAQKVMLTTETSAPDLKILERLGVVTAECAFGMNVFRDLFASVRDVVGGRSKAVQGTLRENREAALSELRKEAALLGADAVVGVDLDYSEVGTGNMAMMFLVASGTAVRLENPLSS